MIIYRKLVSKQSSSLQHLYFLLTGLLVGWFVIGSDVKHSLYAILATYLILLAAGGTLTSVIISFIFNFGYLLVGYYYTESEGYDICWTMPHCVLTLRLIGLTFDCYDGDKSRRHGKESLSKDQEKTALETCPSLLEMLSHSFFVGGYLVGPQFPMKKFQQFTTPSYHDQLPSPTNYALKRLGLSFCYMAAHLVGGMFVPQDWPASDNFYRSRFITKSLLLGFWMKFTLSKYVSAWLMAEGVCIMSGLSWTGQDWKGCANVKVIRLETSRKFGHVIESFNINTNQWVAVYIYKRLKFLGNRNVSQIVTLVFLAIWHGFHTGYYLVFFNEFLSIMVEREFLSIWSKSTKARRWSESPLGSKLLGVISWLYVVLFMPQALIPFVLLTYDKFIPAYMSLYGFFYLVLFSWPLWKGSLKKFLFDENVAVVEKEAAVEEKAATVETADDEVAVTPQNPEEKKTN